MPSLQGAIREGKYDSHLDVIAEEVRRRKEHLAYQLKEGDRVRFPFNTRPAYLGGRTGVILEWRRTRVLVQLDDGPMGKFRSGKIIAFPSSLTKVEDHGG